MSPEQARASFKLDHRCDLWALATIAYEGPSGELPVDGRRHDQLLGEPVRGAAHPTRQRSPGMPPALDASFRRAFAQATGRASSRRRTSRRAFARAAATASDRRAATPIRPLRCRRPASSPSRTPSCCPFDEGGGCEPPPSSPGWPCSRSSGWGSSGARSPSPPRHSAIADTPPPRPIETVTIPPASPSFRPPAVALTPLRPSLQLLLAPPTAGSSIRRRARHGVASRLGRRPRRRLRRLRRLRRRPEEAQ